MEYDYRMVSIVIVLLCRCYYFIADSFTGESVWVAGKPNKPRVPSYAVGLASKVMVYFLDQTEVKVVCLNSVQKGFDL